MTMHDDYFYNIINPFEVNMNDSYEKMLVIRGQALYGLKL